MILNDVLKLLEHNNPGMDRKHLFQTLFEPDIIDIDIQKVKNTFSKRPLDARTFNWICSDDGFLLLCKRIHDCYLRMTGNLRSIYFGLCGLIQKDTHLPEKSKAELISFCNPQDQESLSRFVALCILCANNNTNQEKSGVTAGDGIDYGINLHTYINCLPTPMEYRLWKASQRDLVRSRMEGSRFSSFNIIQNLLPKGYITVPRFEAKGMIDGGKLIQVMDICRESSEHIAVVGDGGIGKTTFLHQIMLDEYMDNSSHDPDKVAPTKYKSGYPVPFFIELNRCPSTIREWRDDTLQKSNFITRYIGQMFEGHLSMDAVGNDTLTAIEKEFQRTPEDGKPHYLLLLDGFNEVRSSRGHSIRSELSNEITVLGSYPNIRIITTSRETQAAYFAADFKNVKLIGLEEADILSYLQECGTDMTKSGLIKANKKLMECLRIPLNLCMFCMDDGHGVLPETQGEIFYNFFHRDSSFYNIRSRAEETRTNTMDKFQTAFILDFILPFIGWTFEHNDSFSANSRAVESMIQKSIAIIECVCCNQDSIPYKDFEYEPSILQETIESFRNKGKTIGKQILDCIHGYLGILYLHQTETGIFAERNRYLFCHHQFRDYFSAMWDIQMLSLLPCIPVHPQSVSFSWDSCSDTISQYTNHSFWSSSKTELISQILMEHRNCPVLNSSTQRWELPNPSCDEQRILKEAINFCRKLTKAGLDSHFLLRNIISAIVTGRGELSGEDLHGLDFKSCNFFNVRCSRTSISNILAANFNDSHLYEECFVSECHRYTIIDFLYHNRFCYTLDLCGYIKCWDILSGKMEFELCVDSPQSLHDIFSSSSGYFKLSPDQKWLAIKLQNSLYKITEIVEIGVTLIALNPQGYVSTKRRIILNTEKHNSLNAIFFTGDSNAVLLLCDKTVIYCYQLNGTLLYKQIHNVLAEETILYTSDSQNSLFAFTSDYNIETDTKSTVNCYIYELSYNSNDSKELYHFTGMDKTPPTVSYIPDLGGFLLFNYGTMQIEFFNCSDKSITVMFPSITKTNDKPPAHFHLHTSHPGECYIMYPDICYLVDLKHPNNSGIIMKYVINGITKLLPTNNIADELYFKTAVAPANGRFVVTNHSSIYEWDSENDILLSKYNTTSNTIIDLICDAQHDELIVVCADNSINIFSGGSEFVIKNSIIFHEEGYQITMSCLDPKNHILALVFSNSNHKKVLLLNLDSGMQRYCFSTQQPNESILSFSFSKSGKFLLIVTCHSCYEYELSQNRLWNIISIDNVEQCLGGNYVLDDIEIAVVPYHQEDATKSMPRCIHYKRKPYKDTINYKLQDYYLLPELTEKLYQGFVSYFTREYSRKIERKIGIRNYWVTRGFFYPPEDGVLEFQLPTLKYFDENGKPKRKKNKVASFEMIYFRHRHPLHFHFGQYNGRFVSYIYLNENTGEAVFIEDEQYLFYCSNYKNTSYHKIWHEYDKKIGKHSKNFSWSNIIPWCGNHLIGCNDNSCPIILDAITGDELGFIKYTPGMAIFGCDFRKAVLDEELKKELKNNGGQV